MARTQSGLALTVRVHPRAGATQVYLPEHGEQVQVRVTAPAAEDRANKATIEAVADWLGVAKSRVILVQGHKAREKTFEIMGLTEDELAAKMEGLREDTRG